MMKKKAFPILLISLFAIVAQVKSNKVIGDTWYIYGDDAIDQLSKPSEAFTKIKLVGTFTGWGGGFLINKPATDKGSITTIDLSEAILPDVVASAQSGGYTYDNNTVWSFKNFPDLKTIVWPSNLKTISPFAFYGCGIEEVTIPSSVETIYEDAFGNCDNLVSVTIQPSKDHPFSINKSAFNCKNIRYVYLNTPVYEIDGVKYPKCEYEAFSFDATDGQTQISNLVGGECATLVLPDEAGLTPEQLEKTYEWYVGSYKEDLVVTQSNIVDSRDNYAGNNNYEENIRTTHGGWWQFFRSTSGNVIPIKGGEDFIRTFSDVRAYELPVGWCGIATDVYNASSDLQTRYPKTTPVQSDKYPGAFGDWYETGGKYYFWAYTMEAYRVVNYTEDESGKNNQNPIDPLVHVVSIPNYIPSQTGVILRSSFAGESRIQYLKKSNSDTEELYYKDTPLDEGDRKANLLYPSVTSVLVHPVDKGGVGNFVEGGAITHRNFGFTTKKFGATTTNPKFVRLKEGNTNINRAYLKLPVALFPHNNENADGLNVTTSAKSFVGFDFDSSTSNRAPSSTSESDAQPLDIVGFEDNHAFTLVFPTVEETGIITAVEQVETTRNDNNFYTLQGVRVENPSKGVYIKNGKKFIIK